jgi:hypothetical protein
MSITRGQVQEVLKVRGYDQELIELYINFAEKRLGPEWISLFDDDDGLVEDVDLFIEARALETSADNTTT